MFCHQCGIVHNDNYCKTCFNDLVDAVRTYHDYKNHGLEHYELEILQRITMESSAMTPEEELYKYLFNDESKLVCNMDTLEFRAHQDQLSKIAKEARVRYYITKDLEKKRDTKDGKPTGFARSVNTDETTTNAINAVKDRQKRLTKQEKMAAGFAKLGISQDAINKLMSNGNILAALANKNSEEKSATEKPEYKPEATKAFNPFEKK